jgi:hypothetical protein
MHIHPVCYHLFVIGKKKPLYDKDGNEMVICATKHHTLLSKAMNPTTTAGPDTPQRSQKKKSLDDPDTPQRSKQKKGNGAEAFSNALIKNGYNVWLNDGKNGPEDPNDSISLLIAWITKQENYDAYCIGVKAQICNRIADWLTKEMGVRTERTGKDVRNKIDTLKLQFKNAVTYMRGTGAGLEHTDPEGFMARIYKVCPYYDDLAKVMHNRAGTEPPYVSDDRSSMYAGGITAASKHNINSTKEVLDDSTLCQDDFSNDVYVDANEEELLMPSVLQMGIAEPVNKIIATTNFKPTAPSTSSSQKKHDCNARETDPTKSSWKTASLQ